jgi:hypothetical protein
MSLSDRWVIESEELLKRMKRLSLKDKNDRLEVINSILFTLNALERSLHGWKLWVGNLSLMSQFTLEELAEIETALEKQIYPFIEYDIEATRKWQNKFPQIPVTRRQERNETESHGLYV